MAPYTITEAGHPTRDFHVNFGLLFALEHRKFLASHTSTGQPQCSHGFATIFHQSQGSILYHPSDVIMPNEIIHPTSQICQILPQNWCHSIPHFRPCWIALPLHLSTMFMEDGVSDYYSADSAVPVKMRYMEKWDSFIIKLANRSELTWFIINLDWKKWEYTSFLLGLEEFVKTNLFLCQARYHLVDCNHVSM